MSHLKSYVVGNLAYMGHQSDIPSRRGYPVEGYCTKTIDETGIHGPLVDIDGKRKRE